MPRLRIRDLSRITRISFGGGKGAGDQVQDAGEAGGEAFADRLDVDEEKGVL